MWLRTKLITDLRPDNLCLWLYQDLLFADITFKHELCWGSVASKAADLSLCHYRLNFIQQKFTM